MPHVESAFFISIFIYTLNALFTLMYVLGINNFQIYIINSSTYWKKVQINTWTKWWLFV